MHLLVRQGCLVGLLMLLSVLQLTYVSSQPYGPTATSLYGIAPAMPLPIVGHSPMIEPVSGIIRVLVIAIAFSDVNYTLSIPQLTKNYLGMLSAYYREISYGKLTIQGEVYGWFKLPYPKAHYGRDCKGINDPNCSGVNQSWHIVEDAVPLVEKKVDFRRFDYFVFIHSGVGQETSRISDDIWSVTYLDASIETSSIALTRFNIVPELESPPSVPNGVWCVEFAHNLGIPDLYNTANGPNNAKPILGPWELMDKGSWNGDPPGSLPAHMTAWPKIQLGFINGTELISVNSEGTFTFTIDPTEIASNNVHAIKIPIDDRGNSTQYYLVEARRQTGFDSALPAEGVLITYVNNSATIGIVRVVNSDPSVVSLEDAVWKVHQTYSDTVNGVSITIVGEIGRAYQVRVVREGVSSPTIVAQGEKLPSQTHITIAGIVLSVEIARNTSAQIKGLSGRNGLNNDSGMLFVFDHEDYWSFWMADMKFPLDIIWFNSNRQAVWIEPNLQPCVSTSCIELTPEAPAMYVLEVSAGFASSHQIKLGTTFTFNAA